MNAIIWERQFTLKENDNAKVKGWKMQNASLIVTRPGRTNRKNQEGKWSKRDCLIRICSRKKYICLGGSEITVSLINKQEIRII